MDVTNPEERFMKHYLSAIITAFSIVACVTATNPELVEKIDHGFSRSNTNVYTSAKPFKHPQPYQVGQYIVTGVTQGSEKSVSKMALVGREEGGWIIETHSITPSSESISQMLVKGMESVYNTGTIDQLEIVWVKIQSNGEHIQTLQGPLLNMTKGLYKQSLEGLESEATFTPQAGPIRVPAGLFENTAKADAEVSFMGKSYQSTSWYHPAVPINGMVKSVSTSDGTVMELLDFGLSGAKRSF
jgi:hypothetical protein